MKYFVIYEGKKAYTNFFICQEGYDYVVKLISLAGPPAVVQGLKISLISGAPLRLVQENEDGKLEHVRRITVSRSPYKAYNRKLPSGNLQTVLVDMDAFNIEGRINPYDNFMVVYGLNEEECQQELYNRIKALPIPFHEKWTPWLWSWIPKEKLVCSKGTAYVVRIRSSEVEEKILEELDDLEKLIPEVQPCKIA